MDINLLFKIAAIDVMASFNSPVVFLYSICSVSIPIFIIETPTLYFPDVRKGKLFSLSHQKRRQIGRHVAERRGGQPFLAFAEKVQQNPHGKRVAELKQISVENPKGRRSQKHRWPFWKHPPQISVQQSPKHQLLRQGRQKSGAE